MFAAVLSLALAAAPPRSSVDKSALASFQGNWQVREVEQGGRRGQVPEKRRFTLTFTGVRVRLWAKNARQVEDGVTVINHDAFMEIVALNTSSKPHAIDCKFVNDNGHKVLLRGIYKLEGDTLTWCYDEESRPRPTAFATKKGSVRVIFWLKRQKK